MSKVYVLTKDGWYRSNVCAVFSSLAKASEAWHKCSKFSSPEIKEYDLGNTEAGGLSVEPLSPDQIIDL